MLSRVYNCDMIDEDFIRELYQSLDFGSMTKRNEQITKKIRELLKKNPQEKYIFAVGAGKFLSFLSAIHSIC